MAITRPLGFLAGATTANIKESGKPDLALIVCEDGPRASSGAVFTSNRVIGEPIRIGRQWRDAYLNNKAKPLRAVLINAGNANAATGKGGYDDAQSCAALLAGRLDCNADQVLPSSTGIIGRRLPVQNILDAIPSLCESAERGHDVDDAVAEAIMTTDLVPKTAHREVEISGHQVHIGAVAKGSGMIAPQLDKHATMLAFITTDAPFAHGALQTLLERASCRSFDRISVDGHPSCSDTVVAMSSGAAPIDPIETDDNAFHVLANAVTSLSEELAEMIVRDGEGATKTFRVEVVGAATEDDATCIARTVTNSPLVKCAVHGGDPNWGRVVTAAGYAGVEFQPAEVTLEIGDTCVYRNGMPTDTAADDPAVTSAMNADPVLFRLRVGDGPGSAWFLGCDLSDGYVRINADYTT